MMSADPQHIFFLTRRSARQLGREAAARRVRSSTLAAAIVNAALNSDLIDAILDGEKPAKLAGGSPRDPVFGLTANQRAAILAIGENIGNDGWCLLSSCDIARIIGLRQVKYATRILSGLEQRDLVVRAPWQRGLFRPTRLTPDGDAVFRSVAGEEGA